jgi:signal transduction histidine kinase
VVILVDLAERRLDGQPLFTRHSLTELLIFGLGYLALGGVLLSTLAQIELKHMAAMNRSLYRENLLRGINTSATWNELSQAVVNFPRFIAPVEAAGLWVYDPAAGGFELTHLRRYCDHCPRARWYDPPALAGLCGDEVPDDQEEPWFYGRLVESGEDDLGLSRYFLPLQMSNACVGILDMALPLTSPLTAEQQQLFTDLAPEITLAVDDAWNRRQHQQLLRHAEAERRRIAHNLHDDLAQNLLYLRNKLELLSLKGQAAQETPAGQPELARMRQVVDESYTLTRSLLSEIESRPALDLHFQLADRAHQARERLGLDLDFQNHGQPQPVAGQVARQVLRIFSELLVNVEKHARARQVQVRLTWLPGCLELVVQDDGCGFVLPREISNQHLGLAIMQERSDRINARLYLQSAPGTGTCARLCVPLGQSEGIE